MGGRLLWIDWTKVLGISMVVYVHLPDVPYRPIIYIVSIPLFFMLSGLLYKPRPIREELCKICYSLLIPYLFYNGVLLLFTPPDDVLRGIVDIFAGNQEQLPGNYRAMWFIVSLIVIRIVCSCFIKYIWYVPFVSIIIYFILRHFCLIYYDNDYFQLNTTLLCSQYFIFGHYLKKTQGIGCLNNLSLRSKSIIIITSIVILSFIGQYCIGNVNLFRCMTGDNFILFLILSYLLPYLLIRLFKDVILLNNSFIQVISEGTLFILCTHQSVILLIKDLGIIESGIITPLLLSFIILVISYIPIKISNRYAPFLIGKRLK